MSKQAIINQVATSLHAMGVPVQIGSTTDLIISHEFIDASWSTGVKKIKYESQIFFDDQNNTVFMCEKTIETGGGISGGFEGGTTFQSGKTLFRKVKSIQFGPDGKAYEYSLDLGAIPKTIKETARQFGWKFQTVLKKSKAEYPAGYQLACAVVLPTGIPFVPPAATPHHELVEPEEQQLAKKQSRNVFNTLALIAYIFLGLVIFGLFALMPVETIGWIIAVPVLGLSALAQFTIVKKGCVTGFVLWFVTAVVLLVIFLLTYVS